MKNTESFAITAILLLATVSFNSLATSAQVPSAFASVEDHQIIITDMATNQECKEQDICYSDSGIIIDKGQTVMWQNNDYVTHTIKSGSHEFGSNGLFSSQRMMTGDSFSQTFSESGFYTYYCPSHPWMIGAILVK